MTEFSIFPALAALLVVAALVVMAVAAVAWARSRPERPIIVPMYDRPPGIDLLESAALVRRDRRGVPSMLVDLAVRRVLRILVEDAGRGSRFTLELLSREGLSPLETRLVGLLFGSTAGVGARHELPDAVAGTGESPALVRLRVAARRSIRTRGLMRAAEPTGVTPLRRAAGGVLLASIVFFVISLVADQVTGWAFLAVLLSGLTAGAMKPRLLVREPLPSPEGARLRDHLLGLRMYLELAEQERFRMLQSPEGAERVNIFTVDDSGRESAVKLYERLLPFAVLWGLDDRWTREMSPYLPEDAGDWYGGSFADFAVQYAVLSAFLATDSNLDDSASQDDQNADADGEDPGDGDASDGGDGDTGDGDTGDGDTGGWGDSGWGGGDSGGADSGGGDSGGGGGGGD